MRNLYQTDTTGPFDIAACSGLADANTHVYKSCRRSGNFAGHTEWDLAVDAATVEIIYKVMRVWPDVGGTNWPAGTWAVRINVTAANTNVIFDEVYVCRIDENGNNLATVGSLTGINEEASAGVHTFNVPGSQQTVNASDHFYIVVGAKRKDGSHGGQHIGVTTDQMIDTPLSPLVGDYQGRDDQEIPETVVYKKTAAGGDALVKMIDEEERIPETVPRARTIVRIRDENESIVETVPRRGSLVRVKNEDEQVDEIVVDVRVTTIVKMVDEEEQVPETTLQFQAIVQVVDEEEQVPGTTARPLMMIRVEDEEGQISETTVDAKTAGGAALIKVIDDVEEIPETTPPPPRNITYLTTGMEQIGETVIRSRTLVRIINEVEQVAKAVLRLRTGISTMRVIYRTLKPCRINGRLFRAGGTFVPGLYAIGYHQTRWLRAKAFIEQVQKD